MTRFYADCRFQARIGRGEPAFSDISHEERRRSLVQNLLDHLAHMGDPMSRARRLRTNVHLRRP